MVDNKELRKLIGFKVGKFNGEPLTEEDLLAVKDLGIVGKSLDGQELSIDLEELKKLSNLEILSVSQTQINNTAISHLNSLPKLKSLMLAKCDIAENTIVELAGINSLVINGCNIADRVLLAVPEDVTLAEENIDLKTLAGKNRLKRLVLAGCKVPSLRPLSEFKSLEKISLEGTTVEDSSIEEMKKQVEISEKGESNPIR